VPVDDGDGVAEAAGFGVSLAVGLAGSDGWQAAKMPAAAAKIINCTVLLILFSFLGSYSAIRLNYNPDFHLQTATEVLVLVGAVSRISEITNRG